MPVAISCTNLSCQKTMIFADGMCGSLVRCPSCKASVYVPHSSELPPWEGTGPFGPARRYLGWALGAGLLVLMLCLALAGMVLVLHLVG